MECDDRFYRSILDNIDDGVYSVDLQKRISYWSPGAERIAGYTSEAVTGRSCGDGMLVHVDDDGVPLCGANCPLEATMKDGEPRQVQAYLHHSAGHRVPVVIRSAPMYGASGQIEGAVETFSDNSRLRTALKRVSELSEAVARDPLTGVGNRHSLTSGLQSSLAECRQLGNQAGVLFIDIDRFKRVNDNHGHDVGDRVLVMVANTLRRNLRASDFIGRWGGEEFLAVMVDVDSVALSTAAEKLRMLVAASFLDIRGSTLRVTISLGATLTRPEDTPASVVQRADALLYQSKARGRNRVTLAA